MRGLVLDGAYSDAMNPSALSRTIGRMRGSPDALIALLVALAIVPDVVFRHEGLAGAAFDVALALALLCRSRSPLLVFAVISGVAFAQWLADVRVVGDVALLIAFHTVASRERASRTLAAAGVLIVGVGLAVGRWFHDQEVIHNQVLRGIVLLSALSAAAGILGYGSRQRRRVLDSLTDRAARLEHERDQQARLATAAERARLARELHDIVAHNLTVMLSLSEGAARALRENPDGAEAALQIASHTGREALAEMRRLLGVLRDDDTDTEVDRHPQPGVRQIDELLEQVRAAGLPASYRSSPNALSLPEGIQLALYRIAQEALTNTLKHGGPKASATIELTATEQEAQLLITDDGRRAAMNGTDGSGLAGMRERAALYGGVVQAGPVPHGGWRVHARFPLTDDPARRAQTELR